MEVGLNLTADCPDLVSSSSGNSFSQFTQRNVSVIYTSTPPYLSDPRQNLAQLDLYHEYPDKLEEHAAHF